MASENINDIMNQYGEILTRTARVSDAFVEFSKEMEAMNVNDENIMVSETASNVVSKEKLRKIQKDTLRRAADYIAYTFGPMGSNTKIITGNDPQNISSKYSKDGLTVLKNILFQDPIEASILEELIEISRHVESEVGDGTTSTVILSSYIFDLLDKIQQKYQLQPYALIRRFKDVIHEVQQKIEDHGRECTVEDIYDIAMISTNGNTEVSMDIRDIYAKYGMNVDLSVGISNDADTKIKIYDGITITEGMSDPAYINNRAENTAEIPQARVYYFSDPIDTAPMIAYLQQILTANIYDPLQAKSEPIPTVICCPKISRDAEFTLRELVEYLYACEKANMQKPPVCIITDIVASDEMIMDDIANLCGCRKIKKYIDKEIYQADVEKGLAPTLETVVDFFGYCEMVVADNKKTKFINPKYMYKLDEDGNRVKDENGEDVYDAVYLAMVAFLENELKKSEGSENASTTGTIRKRLASLKANMVDYLVGGITIAERDAKKDLVEDAIKNCKSAAKYGVGYAANFESVIAINKCVDEFFDHHMNGDISKDNQIKMDILFALDQAYIDIILLLYKTVYDEEAAMQFTTDDIANEAPRNLRTDDDGPVLCSIRLDIEILDTIAKIISLMVTCNQCLLQAPQLNRY